MARVAVLSDAAILDTSWLLELYEVPGSSDDSRTSLVRTRTAEFVDAGGELFVTVPVLFEFANHITRVSHGNRRRTLAERLRNDIRNSLDRDFPWTIAAVGADILIRSQDVLALAEKFLKLSGSSYSFADISVIDLAEELRRPSKLVKIFTFDSQLEAYSV